MGNSGQRLHLEYASGLFAVSVDGFRPTVLPPAALAQFVLPRQDTSIVNLHYGLKGEYTLFCVECLSFLVDCGSCGDLRCRCALPQTPRLKREERKIMPDRHYDKALRPYPSPWTDREPIS